MKRTKKLVNPEEDILAQWRMMRRRELAQAGLKPATTGPAATVRPEPRAQPARTQVSSSCYKHSAVHRILSLALKCNRSFWS